MLLSKASKQARSKHNALLALTRQIKPVIFPNPAICLSAGTDSALVMKKKKESSIFPTHVFKVNKVKMCFNTSRRGRRSHSEVSQCSSILGNQMPPYLAATLRGSCAQG